MAQGIKNSQIARFTFVGIGNTLINFAVLNFSFYELKLNRIVASVIATSVAVTISFFLNRSFVFRHIGQSWKQPLKFIAVTITGVLVIQNSVFSLFSWILFSHTRAIIYFVAITGLHLSRNFVDINISNVLASLAAMAWNYNGYKRFVFKGDQASNHQ